MTTLAVLVANPREGSRTHALADTVAAALASAVGIDRTEVVDLAALGAALLDPADTRPAHARDTVSAADLLVVATPVYKATYTGLLKVFLDGYGAGALTGVTAVGLIVSAAPAHLLATDIHLRSLLVELGAAVPTRSLGVLESQLVDPDRPVSEFVTASASVLGALVHARTVEEATA